MSLGGHALHPAVLTPLADAILAHTSGTDAATGG